MRMAQAGEFDVLIVYDSTRPSRRVAQLLAIQQSLQQYGVQFECVLDVRQEPTQSAGPYREATTVLEQVIVYARVSGYGEDMRHLVRQVEFLQGRASQFAGRVTGQSTEKLSS